MATQKSKTDKTESILAMLDLPEEEQLEALVDIVYKLHPLRVWEWFQQVSNWDGEIQGYKPKTSLADLAFRLRDEAVRKDRYEWTAALGKVFEHHFPHKHLDSILLSVWFEDDAQPIDWIAAALIAKELVKAGKS